MSCYQFEPSDGHGLANLQSHLPRGMWWDAYRIAGKRAYRLFAAFGRLFDGMSAAICHLVKELNPFTTEQMISEWERALGLPDACLPKATTLEERRAWVIWRLAKRRWTTAAEWKEMAALFGFDIAITPGWYVQRPALFGDSTGGFASFEFPLSFDIFPKLGRFRVYIDVYGVDFAGFEYGAPGTNASVGFPIPFGDTDERLDQLKCMLDRIRPANVVIIWNEFPATDAMACTRRVFDDVFAAPFC